MLIIPSMLRVTGHLERMSPGKSCGKAKAKDGDLFEFEIPILDKGRNPKWTYVVCCLHMQKPQALG
ncbi:hypothetical protein CMEL01_15935 [Colletotrichum melonis]|uniref:Uncharacterized protein n=1 Tax=Colletotrichum melonis TaxID=1209925 RepID=A0AAI9XP71_9PEZI|nr:hypothetical protein CMEL01_15935 [Colletotrichum melonis]